MKLAKKIEKMTGGTLSFISSPTYELVIFLLNLVAVVALIWQCSVVSPMDKKQDFTPEELHLDRVFSIVEAVVLLLIFTNSCLTFFALGKMPLRH